MISVADFREAFPEFTEEMFPTTAVEMRLDLASEFFSEEVWTSPRIRDHAIGLYVAHYLTAYGSKAVGGIGTGSGTGAGLVSSKSVDGASISYDTSTATESNAGFWNSSIYGRELWVLMRVFGGGAVQL